MRGASGKRIMLGLLLAGTAGLTGTMVSHPARAQSTAVTIVNFSFQPATLTVPIGTTVTWTNRDTVTHTTTSDSGVWNSGNLMPGQSFSFTFTQAGSFPYHCMIHPNMHGTIVVQEASSTTTATSMPTAAPATAAATATILAGTATPIPLTAHPAPVRGKARALRMGPMGMARQTIWVGYYDGHHDMYLSTDISSKAEASSMHINYAASLAHVPTGVTPAIYLVQGRAVANQPAVFGSEPGEKDYSPLWRQVIVRWKAGVKPVLLVRDDQIIDLAHKGKLSMRHTNVVLNCPIIKVGK